MALLDVKFAERAWTGLSSLIRTPQLAGGLESEREKKEACMQRRESRPRSQKSPSPRAHGRHTSAANRNQA